jgi:hypothetical protein
MILFRNDFLNAVLWQKIRISAAPLPDLFRKACEFGLA